MRARAAGTAPASARESDVSQVPARSRDSDSCALFDRSDALDEQITPAELGLERQRLVRGQRDQQPAGGLRVVAEREQLLRYALGVDRRELAVARVTARANAGAGDI